MKRRLKQIKIDAESCGAIGWKDGVYLLTILKTLTKAMQSSIHHICTGPKSCSFCTPLLKALRKYGIEVDYYKRKASHDL